MVTLILVCVVTVAFLAFAAYALHMVKPKRLTLKAAFWKVASLMIEADAEESPRRGHEEDERSSDEGPAKPG